MFTHLHVHTEYSMLDGLSRINLLVQQAKQLEMTSLGITDHGGMYGVIDFYSACHDAGIKPIIGCEVYVAGGSRHDRRPADKTPHHLTVLAHNHQGYQNLLKLITKANLEGFYYRPRVDKDLLAEHREGLVVLSGCPSAEVSQLLINEEMAKARDLVHWYQETFPHYYLEIQRHTGLPFQDTLNAGLLTLAEQQDIPLIATNDLHYIHQEDAPSQDMLVCIQTNTNIHDEKRLKMSDDSYYLKSPEQMAELFSDLPEAVRNTQRVADLCDVTLDFSTLHLPEFPVPGKEDADSYLRKLSWQGFEQRFGSTPTAESGERLEYELDVISQTQYPNYFLVVWEIANFARQQQILFGVRGSAASSLALYCLGVTEIDPLEYGLVFERFLNVERKEMPDIDMDFQDDRRDEAIRYVVRKYGVDHVAQIITFGTLGAKAAIRDVGRALALPYADVDQVARMVPARLGVTIDIAYTESAAMQEAYTGDETLRRLIDTARKLEGVVRHASTHAAGVVISKDPLSEHVPLQRPIKGEDQGAIMTQYSMDPLAKLGLLKMDFLGLANLTILSLTRDLVRQNRGIDIDIQAIPLDDQQTFELLSSGETTGLFQLESAGVRRYIKELKPTNLRDLAAMVALYRPGPMDHISTFIDSKHGRVKVKYPHPALQDILKETYGVIVYQDQVLHILRALAGYSLGEADIVRKAMGKKIPVLMAQERDRFVAGATHLGYDPRSAEEVFDLIEPFAGYAFNKAHSVSYAMVAYWTAYLKANYQEEFMTSVLNAYPGNTDKVTLVAGECARLGVPLLPPDVERSQADFSTDTDDQGRRAIRFGLAAVKNVGAAAVAAMVEAREAKGAFGSLEEFCRRAGPGMANRRVLESLVRAGALDCLGPRGQLLAAVDELVGLIQKESELERSGQATMFDLFGQSVPTPLGGLRLQEASEPSTNERGLWERQLLGVSFSGISLQQVAQGAPSDAILSRSDLEEQPTGTRTLVIGPVSAVRHTYDKEQRPIAFATLDLFDGSVEVAVWSRTYAATAGLWEQGTIVQVSATVTRRNDEVGLRCEEVVPYALPEDQDEPAGPPVPGPRMEAWPENGAAADPSSTAVIGQGTVADAVSSNGTREPVMPESLGEPDNGLSATAGGAVASVDERPSHETNGSSTVAADAPRKVLINLTETDHPAEDTYLLRQVLALLLEYPGADSVDLVIFSQGVRYRLEMPIITTRFCPELEAQVAELMGGREAIKVLGPA